MRQFGCPRCGSTFFVDDASSGRVLACPYCGGSPRTQTGPGPQPVVNPATIQTTDDAPKARPHAGGLLLAGFLAFALLVLVGLFVSVAKDGLPPNSQSTIERPGSAPSRPSSPPSRAPANSARSQPSSTDASEAPFETGKPTDTLTPPPPKPGTITEQPRVPTVGPAVRAPEDALGAIRFDAEVANRRERFSFANLDGKAIIVAEDGTYLGKIDSNQFGADSILNDFGKYGNTFSGTSIFNDFSRYGGTIGLQSPFNDLCLRPPKVYLGKDFVGYLTTNQTKLPRIDPHALIGYLKSK